MAIRPSSQTHCPTELFRITIKEPALPIINQPTIASPAPMYTSPQKDYEAAFGALQAQYGFGGLPTPPLQQTPSHPSPRKWYRWGASRTSSTASLIPFTRHSDAISRSTQPPSQLALSDAEMRFGKLTAEHGHGHGPMSHANFRS